MKLDYGSGSQPKVGYKSSDFCGAPGYDYYIVDYKVQDVETSSCTHIHCRNVIHHIPEKDLSILFTEFDRLLSMGGILIISEPMEKYHEQNKFLDMLWYNFVTPTNKIMIPDEYVDYKKYLTKFELVARIEEYQNEILLLRRK